MLQTHTTNAAGLTVAQDELLSFANNHILTGCTVTHTAGSTTIALNRPGFYMVHFNGYGAITTTAGEITVAMFNNGVEVPYASASANSTAATDIVNLAFSTIVQVRPSCAAVNNKVNLTFVNQGEAATFNNLNVVITKLC